MSHPICPTDHLFFFCPEVIRERERTLHREGRGPETMIGRESRTMVLCGTLARYSQMAESINSACGDSSRGDSRGESGCPSPLLTPTQPNFALPGAGAKTPPKHEVDEGVRERLVLQFQKLNELCAGKLDSLSYNEAKTHPQTHPQTHPSHMSHPMLPISHPPFPYVTPHATPHAFQSLTGCFRIVSSSTSLFF